MRRLRGEGVCCFSLDGDELRDVFKESERELDADRATAEYQPSARLTLGYKYARLGQLLARQGAAVTIATISMFHELHAWNRAHLPGYFEVYVRVPFDELRRRDPKDIYKRFDEGKLQNVAGLDVAIEEPLFPDYLADFSVLETAESIAEQIVWRQSQKRLQATRL